MNRAFGIIALYVIVGTIFTLVGYRIALEGNFYIPGFENKVGGMDVFLPIAVNTALSFAAAAVLLSLMLPSGVSAFLAMAVSALTTGLIGLGMMAWFPGLTIAFPVVMAAGGVVCASTANSLGFLNSPGNGRT